MKLLPRFITFDVTFLHLVKIFFFIFVTVFIFVTLYYIFIMFSH